MAWNTICLRVLAILLFIITVSDTKFFSNFPFKKTNYLKQQRVLMISFGGFRHDFIDRYQLVNFAKFRSHSAHSVHLNPQFSTQSYPNHWSIATGAFVENHGIIANKFYDPIYQDTFSHHKHDAKWWNQSEPIWLTAATQGVKSFVHSWPGTEAGLYDSDLYTRAPFSDNSNFRHKINQTIEYFTRDHYKFICLYHNQPDAIAHKYGLDSAEFNVTLQQLDTEFGQMINLLKQSSLFGSNDFNLIVLSDHGIANIRKNVFINEYFSEQDAAIWSFSRTLIHLKPLIQLDLLLLKLSKIPDITVTLKEDMPQRLHYKNHYRIGDVIVSAIEGVGFNYVSDEPVNFNGRRAQLSYEFKKKLTLAAADKANHGYDNVYPDMKGIFMAHGAMFKNGYYSKKAIENVDIYPMLCNILAIECEQRDGHFERSRIFLRYEHRLISSSNRQIVASISQTLVPTSFVFLLLMSLVLSVHLRCDDGKNLV